MKFREPMKLHRKSGIWGTRRLFEGRRAGSAGRTQTKDALRAKALRASFVTNSTAIKR
jgi:hypothetical protein